ncbi:transporter substrate-binding domain-containing protein [Miniphocaeibacter massiliensis]|uniref:transporter substrate-binding domain-containing protein n=1 Tax=Miniphocaeibacter massiliensis TaxID=2041841 RepID=UPI0013E9FB23|nr:transporter substrate-binding domain-containing protein [Miniphocaeibacter massiliensis]
MKKKILSLLLLAVFAFTACEKVEEKPKSNDAKNPTETTEKATEAVKASSKDLEKMREAYEVKVDELKAEDYSKDSTMNKILTDGKLIVATNATYPPFEFMLSVDGKSTENGIDMEMARLLAKKINVELEIVDTSFESLVAGISNGMYDLVLAGMNKDPERDEQVDFSDDYYSPTLTLLQRKSDLDKYKEASDIPDSFKFGNQTGTVQEKVTKVQFPETIKNSLYLESYTDLTMALEAGQIDGILLEDVIAKAFASNNSALAINENITYPGESGFAMAFKEGDKEFQEYLNSFIKEIKDNGTLDKIYNDGAKLAGSSMEDQ